LNYIRYHEVEYLFKKHHTLEAILESLSRELILLSRELDEDYISGALFGGGDGINVQSNKISDSTSRIAIEHRKDINSDYFTTRAEIKIELNLISIVLDKLNIAYRQLPHIQHEILRLYYWEEKNWDEVIDSIKKTKGFIVKKTAQRYRTQGIERIKTIAKIDIDSYQQVVKFLEK